MTAPLSAAEIRRRCAPGAAHVSIEVVEETGSTNADLLARLDTLSGPTLLLAAHQTAGRGRAGRNWLSAPGATLTFSLAWKLQGPPARLAGLPLAVGVILAECLARLDLPVQLKWPNDLLRDGAKLGGILIEIRSAPGQGQGQGIWAVIGIGINLLLPPQLETQIGRAVADAPWLAQMDRHQLMAVLTSSLADGLAEFDGAGFAAFSARWNALHAHQGQSVTLTEQGCLLHEGRAAGVDELGRLLLDTAGGRLEIVSGDVTLRAS